MDSLNNEESNFEAAESPVVFVIQHMVWYVKSLAVNVAWSLLSQAEMRSRLQRSLLSNFTSSDLYNLLLICKSSHQHTLMCQNMNNSGNRKHCSKLNQKKSQSVFVSSSIMLLKVLFALFMAVV